MRARKINASTYHIEKKEKNVFETVYHFFKTLKGQRVVISSNYDFGREKNFRSEFVISSVSSRKDKNGSFIVLERPGISDRVASQIPVLKDMKIDIQEGRARFSYPKSLSFKRLGKHYGTLPDLEICVEKV